MACVGPLQAESLADQTPGRLSIAFFRAIERKQLYGLPKQKRFRAIMTESKWLTSANPRQLLDYLIDIPVSDRKLRLFAAACCRQIYPLFDERSRNAMEIVERYAILGIEEYRDGAFPRQ